LSRALRISPHGRSRAVADLLAGRQMDCSHVVLGRPLLRSDAAAGQSKSLIFHSRGRGPVPNTLAKPSAPPAVRPLVVHLQYGRSSILESALASVCTTLAGLPALLKAERCARAGRADCARLDEGTVRKEKTEESGLHARAAKVVTDVEGNSDDQGCGKRWDERQPGLLLRGMSASASWRFRWLR
jgi:hypothetical protein